jgi:predicted dehydrogenase
MAQAKRTRRQFLRTAAALGAACAIPASVFAGAATRSAKLRWGVIGTGHRGSIHLNAIKSFKDDMQIVALCDVMENHLQGAVGKVGGNVATFTDYQKLLARDDIDAILIATPNCLHHEMVLAALSAGKHVMCEKPMAVSIEQCRAMRAAAEKRPDQVVLYTMQLRYSGAYTTLRSEIEQGRIGKPKFLLFAEFRGDWNRGDVWQYDDPKLGKVNWRFSHAASGGTLNEKVCHYFDILNWMAGSSPQRIRCDGGISVYKDGRDTWDHATTVLSYENDIQATHSLCMFGPKRLDLQVIGENGSLSVGEKSLVLQVKKDRSEIPLAPEIRHGERGPTRGQETAVLKMYDDFLDCVRNKKKPWMDADKAMNSSRTAWLGELSSEQKREVKWDDIA